jgi:DNA primase
MIVDLSNRKERILSRFTSDILFTKYAGTSDGKVLCIFHRERTPSMSIKDARFKCFGCGAGGDVFDYIGRLYGTDFNGSLDIIERDCAIIKKIVPKVSEKSDTNISWTICAWQFKHLKYWEQYNIDINILKQYRVYPLSYVKKGDDTLFADYKDNLAFLYWFKRGWKIYVPGVTFYGNRACIQGIENLKFNSTLIITKGYKDVMFFDTCGYTSIAPASENTEISPVIMNYVLRKFKRVIINFDNDEPGRRARDKYIEKYTVETIECPYYKDFTDMCKYEGFEKTNKLISELL